MEGRNDMLAENRRLTTSTATTVSSESKQTGKSSNTHGSSCILEAETDPTSLPSEMFDEPDRKDTESPVDSNMAVYGSDSVHSASSEYSTERSDSKRRTPAAVDLDKVEAMGGQFEEPYDGGEAASFHNPENDIEAEFIKDKVKKANTTMDDIDLHPDVHFRHPGTSFQVSARPKDSPEPGHDAEGDNTHKRKLNAALKYSLDLDQEEGHNVVGLRRRSSCCCIIM